VSIFDIFFVSVKQPRFTKTFVGFEVILFKIIEVAVETALQLGSLLHAS
jgi:hypothetical protein